MRLLSRLTLWKGFLLIAFTSAVGLGWYNYGVQDTAMQSSIEELEVMRGIAERMSNNQEAHAQLLLGHVFTKDAGDTLRRRELHHEMEVLDQRLESLFQDSAEGRLLLGKYRTSRNAMESAEEKLFATLSGSVNSKQTLLDYREWKSTAHESGIRISDLEGYLTARLNVVMQENSELTQDGLLVLAFIFVLGLLSIFLSHIHFYWRLIVPIEKLEAALKNLAHGDFATRVQINSRDELGVLGESFNKMAGQLQTMTESLAASNESLKNFTAIVGHDLRSPIASMLGYLDLMKHEDIDLQSRKEMTEVVEKIASRTLGLLSMLLSYATAQSKKLEVTRLNPRAEMEHVMVDLAEDIQKSGGKVELLDMPEVDADPIQFQELFRNLVSNALKYCRPEVSPEVSVRGYKTNHNGREVCRFEVRDNGIGFDDSRQKELFQAFHRLERPAQIRGTGMGLSICKTIVDRHKGWIRAQSRIGKGTIFTVEIPRELKKMLMTEAK